jgi:ABC-2 type transport system permease protein
MIADIWTVMWKEWKELLVRRGSMRGGILSLLLVIGILGIFAPLQMGRAWVESLTVLGFSSWMPLLLVTSVVADSFAGERERHTLETLLASRLPDWAILLGKIGTAMSYGWGLTLTSLLLGVVTVSVAHGRGELLMYSPLIGFGAVGSSLLTAGLAATAGVLISLRASTVRQAQQTMRTSSMLLLLLPLFGVRALPVAWRASLVGAFTAFGTTNVVLMTAAIVVVLDIGLLVAAMTRFQRARLILD